MQFYIDETREPDPYALPDAEVFYRRRKDNEADGWLDSDGDVMSAGWYFWCCFPGCMPDSDPSGPYTTEQDAIDAARDLYADDNLT